MQTTITEAITEGYRNAKFGKVEEWGNPISPYDHPNKNMLLASDPLNVVERQVQDRTFGENGFVRFAIRATGAQASKIADEFCGHINARCDKEGKKRFSAEVIREARSCVLNQGV